MYKWNSTPNSNRKDKGGRKGMGLGSYIMGDIL
jgi:hypothetical protein